MQDQARSNHSMERQDGRKVPPPQQRPIGNSQFSLKTTATSRPTTLLWKATHSWMYGQDKLYVIGDRMKEYTELERVEGRDMDVGRAGERINMVKTH